nr:MAG TPA: hypothetical protein [Caudoviricetes sp.]
MRPCSQLHSMDNIPCNTMQTHYRYKSFRHDKCAAHSFYKDTSYSYLLLHQLQRIPDSIIHMCFRRANHPPVALMQYRKASCIFQQFFCFNNVVNHMLILHVPTHHPLILFKTPLPDTEWSQQD